MTGIGRSEFASTFGQLADVGRDPVRGGYSRHVFDDADRTMREWFTEAAARRGLDVETDRNGNIWAWWMTQGGASDESALVTGSHLDSVPGGGAFDGPLGVVSALLAVDELRARGVSPARPLAIVCFAEEEGGRFGLPCLGSRLLAGITDPDTARALTDPAGITFAEAADRAGIDPRHIGPDPARLAQIGTFIELHVEQGRLLRAADPGAAVGIASSIVAHGRWRVTITGAGNHAGTTAIADRSDPMVVAANAVLATRAVANERGGAVATVGRIEPIPGGTNVIASQVRLWLDARYGTAADTEQAVAAIGARIRQYAANEGCTVEIVRESASPEVMFDPELRGIMAGAIGGRVGPDRGVGGSGADSGGGASGVGGIDTGSGGCPVVPTGAGHDAGVLAPYIRTGMLFVRNPTGISHAPGEYAEVDDCVAGVHALADVLAALA